MGALIGIRMGCIWNCHPLHWKSKQHLVFLKELWGKRDEDRGVQRMGADLWLSAVVACNSVKGQQGLCKKNAYKE